MNALRQIIIVGFGVAGRLHGRILREMSSLCAVSAIVDSSPLQRQKAAGEFPSAKICQEIAEALDEPDARRIIDFCVPSCKYHSLAKASQLIAGDHTLFVEKPLGWNQQQAEDFFLLTKNTRVSYLDTYSCSKGIQKLHELVSSQQERLMTIEVLFSKDRRSDSMQQRGYHGLQAPNAWLIEGPHLVSIALTLAGTVTGVRQAELRDMPLAAMPPVRGHGGGSAMLVHQCGAITRLETHLFSAINRRTVRVALTDGTLYTLELPASNATLQQTTLSMLLPNGKHATETFEDQPMKQCLHQALDNCVNPSSMQHGMQVSRILQAIIDASSCNESIYHHQCAQYE